MCCSLQLHGALCVCGRRFVILPCRIQEYADKKGFVWTGSRSGSGSDSGSGSGSGSGGNSGSDSGGNSGSDSGGNSGSGSGSSSGSDSSSDSDSSSGSGSDSDSGKENSKGSGRGRDDDSDADSQGTAKKARQFREKLDEAAGKGEHRCSYGELCLCPTSEPGAVCPCGAPTHHLCYLQGHHFRDAHQDVEEGEDGGGAKRAACPDHCLVAGCKSCFTGLSSTGGWDAEGRLLCRPAHIVPALLSLQSELQKLPVRESEQEKSKVTDILGGGFMDRSTLDMFLQSETPGQIRAPRDDGSKVSAPRRLNFVALFTATLFSETVDQQRHEHPHTGRTVRHGGTFEIKARAFRGCLHIQTGPLQDR
jgi:hypothetical protein